VQRRPRGGAQPGDVARIRRNLRLPECEVQHDDFSLLGEPGCVSAGSIFRTRSRQRRGFGSNGRLPPGADATGLAQKTPGAYATGLADSLRRFYHLCRLLIAPVTMRAAV